MSTRRKKSIFIVLSLFLLLSCSRQEQTPTKSQSIQIDIPQGWQLVWHDEFDGSDIDPSKWEHEVNAQGGGNNELQYYTDRAQNSYVKDGVLVIQALKELYTGPEGTREYTSARLHTKNKGDWKYGSFVIRAKLPSGKGLWPAIWMLPTDNVYGDWAASGEIDIMELLGHEPNKIYGSLHYGGEWPKNVHTVGFYTLPHGTFAQDFHVFSLQWSPTQFCWYVDGVLYQKQTEWYTAKAPYPAPFDQRFHLILNIAIGGTWPGDPDTNTVFPQKMVVDYVRFFKKENN